MQVIITGATGFIGRNLLALLQKEGHSVTTLTRDATKAQSLFGSSATCLGWDNRNHWQQAVANADAVFHLAGTSVAGQRWSPEYKREIRSSRVDITHALVEAKPRVLISASAVGYYGDNGDAILTETSPPGDDFLADVCVRWEEASRQAEAHGARVAIVRIGQVLGRGGGTLEAMLNPPIVPFSPWKMGVGGPLGDGKQWMPWIHLSDVSRLFLWCAEHHDVSGPFNAVSPNPVTNREFSAALGRVLHRPSALPVPAFALRALLGEFADAILCSQRVHPTRTQEKGFTFQYTDVETALQNILN